MSQLQHPEWFDDVPDAIPDVVVRIWKAIDRYYATGTHKAPTWRELLEYFDAREHMGERSLSRARKDYPTLLPWPVKRGQRPPWLENPQIYAAMVAGDTMAMRLPPDPQVLCLVVDRRGIIQSANEAACRVSGYSRAELEGSPYEPLLHLGAEPTVTRDPELHDRVRLLPDEPGGHLEYDTFWITKAHPRVELRCHLTWEPVTNCYAMRLHVIPAETRTLRFGPGALVATAASVVIWGCLPHHPFTRTVAHMLHAVGGLPRLLG